MVAKYKQLCVTNIYEGSGDGSRAIASANSLICGLNKLSLAMSGHSVRDVLECLGGPSGILNVAPNAAAFVDGKAVDFGHVLEPGQRLELIKASGQKAAWEEADRILLERLALSVETIAETIRRTPRHAAKESRLSPLEELIVHHLGDKTLRAKAIAELCGEDVSSHFKATLSQLVKRDVLLRNADGYHVNCQDIVA